ncbi:glycosyltransferase family 2 protein [Vannielia sp.]|uniref:glycosyltransferase family 2 protein n=1 Tax=Vannielia sp. TaxID=2813045 RepID=UPI002614629F|nr:glycosyltransferase family 2 protein [Vannielia sp.]MDF1873062.1 glycosyltransferase family 2 protein [Vannielia sp.]
MIAGLPPATTGVSLPSDTSETPVPLTVILPFYDEIAFLSSALRSIAAQGIAGVEVIVVNDNPERFSPDDIRALGATPPVRLLSHVKNEGLSAARNTGLAAAKGAFIAFLDSDDYYTSGGLAAQLALAKQTGADITHAPCYLSREGGPELGVLHRDDALHRERRTTDGLLQAEEAQFIVSSWSSIYARRFLAENALTFDPAQPRFEDRLFVLQTTTRAGKIAYLGTPTRVWRRRAGSISVSPTTPDTLRLQVQLLEKCLAVVRSEVAANRLPARFEKRELFNAVSRLIWDMEIIPLLAAAESPETAAFGPRLRALLGDDSFSNAFFDDPMVAKTSRVGMKTRRGRITRLDFFELHKLLREGRFVEADALLRARAPAPAEPPRPCPPLPGKLVLHLGLHKTGSTYIQHNLLGHRERLLERRILIPSTGLSPPEEQHTRDGAFPGHQGLLAAHRKGDEQLWRNLYREIIGERPGITLISCENMGLPTDPTRNDLIARLMQRLSGFKHIDLVALGRRADTYGEALYKEVVTGGQRGGARSLEEFLVDYGTGLTDWPTLFAPFEEASGTQVRLADFDRLATDHRIWEGFRELADLPDDLGPIPGAPRYPSPDRESIELVRLVNMLVEHRETRRELIRGYFALNPTPINRSSLLPPARRIALLEAWQARSAEWASSRGYTPDIKAMCDKLHVEKWHAPEAVSTARLEDLLLSAQSSPMLMQGGEPARPAARNAAHDPAVLRLNIRLRPWVRRLLRRWV